MNVTHIKVEYPTQLRVVLNTEAEMRAKGYKNYKGDCTKTVNVNRTEQVRVRTNKVVDLDAMCLAQTGMTPSAYQAKFNRSWNA